MKTILITGAAGLIGSRFAEWILSHYPETELLLVDNLSGGFYSNIEKMVDLPNVHFFQNDMGNMEEMEPIFKKYKPDLVYHAGAYAAECVSPFIRTFNYTNNLTATAAIVNLCINYDVKRLVFFSSMATYGKGEPPFSEDSPLRPIDPYGIAKYAAEMDIQIAGEQHNLDWCIIVPHNVIGRNQNIWDNYRNVFGIWIRRTLEQKPMLVYGDGLQERAFSVIDDILKPLWLAGTSPLASRQRINLGGIEHISIKDSANLLRDVMGKGVIEHMPPRHEVKYAYSTWDKSVSLLGFEHKTSLRDGLKEMWEWAQLQPRREQFVWEKFEVEKGVYHYWKPSFLRN